MRPTYWTFTSDRNEHGLLIIILNYQGLYDLLCLASLSDPSTKDMQKAMT